VGRRFSYEELADLSAEEPPERPLAELERRRLVHRTEQGDLYRFHHVLVRDVAYRGIPKAERAALHERAGKSLDRREGADELVGYHYEQAVGYLTELARAGDHAHELAAAGGERLGRAGIRAWKRSDTPAAVNLLGRATALLPDALVERRQLLCELGVALRTSGDLRAAEDALAEAMDESVAAGDQRLELRAAIERANVRTFRHPETAPELLELATNAIPVFEKLRDDRALGRAWFLVGRAKGSFQCDYGASEEAATKAVLHYRKAGWSPGAALNGLVSALYYGPRPVEEAAARCAALLEEHRGDRASEANILVYTGGLEAMRGRFDDARRLVGEAEAKYLELGQTLNAVDHCGFIGAAIEILAARPETAEERLRRAAEACIAADETALLSTRGAQLADVLYVQGRYEEAGEWLGVAREHAAANDLDAQMRVRSVEAKLQARSGSFVDAEDAARAAVALSDQSDALNDRAQVSLDLAEVLRLAGRQDEAREPTAAAVALYERKGNAVAADRARSLLAGALVG
jgi:tetratricopeptide (TPR) repeat protein